MSQVSFETNLRRYETPQKFAIKKKFSLIPYHQPKNGIICEIYIEEINFLPPLKHLSKILLEKMPFLCRLKPHYVKPEKSIVQLYSSL